MRPALAILVLVPVVALAGCGGGSDEPTVLGEGSSSTTGASLPDWVEARLVARDGPDVALVMGTSDYGVGANRITFLLVRDDNSIVHDSQAAVYLRRDGSDDEIETKAALVPIIPHTHPPGGGPPHADPTDIYVANVDLPDAGRYWLVAEPGGDPIQGVGAIDVREATLTPAVGAKAIPSDNPTLADEPASEITTADPPDTDLLRHSVADSLAAGVPFVVAFATPKYCTSRTCGPTVQTVQRVASRFASEPIRFIHVEIYEDNDPKKGVNRWVKEWSLPTEPWVFVVDRDGVIRSKFEGSVSVAELTGAVEKDLAR
ncbi:MAG TPA: hypothetical protein VH650_14025 [Gaiellaceae bacterium]